MRQQQLTKPNCKTCGSEKLKAQYKENSYPPVKEDEYMDVQLVQINLARYDICEEWEGARALLSSQRKREC